MSKMEEVWATLDRIARLNEESKAAHEKRQAEYEKWRAESRASMEKLEKQVKATNETVNGIGRSNGMVTEEYLG